MVLETGDVPRVNLPEHVVSEVVRGLIANALQALRGPQGGHRLAAARPYRAGALQGRPTGRRQWTRRARSIRPTSSSRSSTQSPGRERLGLGLFLAASLLDMYEGRLRYETREDGGACFVVEMPPARFVRGQPYHWFVGGEST